MIRDVANTLMNINSLTRALECSETVVMYQNYKNTPIGS